MFHFFNNFVRMKNDKLYTDFSMVAVVIHVHE